MFRLKAAPVPSSCQTAIERRERLGVQSGAVLEQALIACDRVSSPMEMFRCERFNILDKNDVKIDRTSKVSSNMLLASTYATGSRPHLHGSHWVCVVQQLEGRKFLQVDRFIKVPLSCRVSRTLSFTSLSRWRAHKLQGLISEALYWLFLLSSK